MATMGAAILMSSFDKNLFLLSATGFSLQLNYFGDVVRKNKQLMVHC